MEIKGRNEHIAPITKNNLAKVSKLITPKCNKILTWRGERLVIILEKTQNMDHKDLCHALLKQLDTKLASTSGLYEITK